MEKFKELGLSDHVLKVIAAKKFEKPSEIQVKTIPLVLAGKDIIAGSATGSGKTLAFGAGLIKAAEKGEGIKGLVLTPTRELAEQVAGAIEEFAYHKEIEVATVYGGVSIENQMKKLTYANIVVATPGRLLDHMQRNSIDLSKVKVLVLDEADRMWDMGFKDDVGKIVKACPEKRQSLLFSATISSELAEFSEKYMNAPVEISVENYVDPSKLKQIYYDVRDDEKFSLLVHLLKHEKAHLVMIFCNTRRNADFVAKNLKLQNVAAQVTHGGLTQAKRNHVIKKFDDSTVNVLVCTDVAARGLDIAGVSHVYNYDIASDAKDYIHRIGRTARAGAEGIAVNILASRDYDSFSNVQRHNPELKIKRVDTPRFEKIFVKMERRDSGGFRRGPPRRSGSGMRRNPPRSGSRGPPRRGGSSGPRRSSNGPRRGPPRSGSSTSRPRQSRDGFRGGGRNTRRQSRR